MVLVLEVEAGFEHTYIGLFKTKTIMRYEIYIGQQHR